MVIYSYKAADDSLFVVIYQYSTFAAETVSSKLMARSHGVSLRAGNKKMLNDINT